jgi:hypothetical protein
MKPDRDRNSTPYYITRTPRGSVVVCAAHTVTDELRDDEAKALVRTLNDEHRKRFA